MLRWAVYASVVGYTTLKKNEANNETYWDSAGTPVAPNALGFVIARDYNAYADYPRI